MSRKEGESLNKVVRGVVRRVSSGDRLQVEVTDGSKIEVFLGHIEAPKQRKEVVENMFFPSTAYLRQMVIGKQVKVLLEKEVSPGHFRGMVEVGGRDVSQMMVMEGFAKVRSRDDTLLDMESIAKEKKKGIWQGASHMITIRQPKQGSVFVDGYNGKETVASVEYIYPNSDIRLVLPNGLVELRRVKLSGIVTPQGRDGEEAVAEACNKALNNNILNRMVGIRLDSYDATDGTYFVTMKLGGSTVAELLLSSGLAKCVEWSAVASDSDKLLAAEQEAKRKGCGLWAKATTAKAPRASKLDIAAQKVFYGMVYEVVSGKVIRVLPMMSQEAIVKYDPERLVSIEMANLDIPRLSPFENDLGWLAKNEMIKKVLGRVVEVRAEYETGERTDKEGKVYPNKKLFTVRLQGEDMGVYLIAKGLAKVKGSREDQRPASYQSMLKAQENAEKREEGRKKEIVDLSRKENGGRAKLVFEELQQTRRNSSERVKARVEYVISGNRIKVYIPEVSAFLMVSLAGIYVVKENDFDVLAKSFLQERCMQRQVQLEMEGMEKGGSIRAHLYSKRKPVAKVMIEEGLVKVGRADQHMEEYSQAEMEAKKEKRGLWSYEQEEEVVVEKVEVEDKPEDMIVGHVDGSGMIYVRKMEGCEGVQKLLKSAGIAEAKVAATKRGTRVAVYDEACKAYVRGRVVGKDRESPKMIVELMDEGGELLVDKQQMKVMPMELANLAPLSRKVRLAFVELPEEEVGYLGEAVRYLSRLEGKHVVVKEEFRDRGISHASIWAVEMDGEQERFDWVNLNLVRGGLARVGEKVPYDLLSELKSVLKEAKEERVGMWKYFVN